MTDRKNQIPFNKPFIIGKELAYISQTISNLPLSGDGCYTKQCHEWLEQRLGCAKLYIFPVSKNKKVEYLPVRGD